MAKITTQIPSISNIGVPEAPIDGIQYGREDATWTPINDISYTDEQAQDAIGTILLDTVTIDLSYNDVIPSISADVKPNSIDSSHLSNSINVSEFVNDSDYATEAYVDSKIPSNYSKVVYVDSNNPNTATIFDVNNPPTVNDDTLKTDVNNLYVGLNASTWVYNSTSLTYITEPITSGTSNFYLGGTLIDAGGNKTAAIERTGPVGVGTAIASNHAVTKAQHDTKGDMTTNTNQTVSGVKTFLAGMFGLRNTANTFTSFFASAVTASRTWTWQDKNGVVAHLDDIYGKKTNINLYIGVGGNDTSAIPDDITLPYATITAIFNYINTNNADNFSIIFLDRIDVISNTRIPNKNISIYGVEIGGKTTLGFNTTTLGTGSVVTANLGTTNNNQFAKLEIYNLQINLASTQQLMNNTGVLFCKNLSITSTSVQSVSSFSTGLVVFPEINGTFGTITLNSGSVTNGGVIGTNAGDIHVKSLVLNTTNQFFVREGNVNGINYNIYSISGTGSITLAYIAKGNFFLTSITGTCSVILSNQGDSQNIFHFNNTIIGASVVVSTGESYGIVTGTLSPGNTKGIIIGSTPRTGSVLIFKDFYGRLEPSTFNNSPTSYIIFVNCNIVFTGTFLLKTTNAWANDLIVFIGVNTFLQSTPGTLIDANGTSLQILKRGIHAITSNATSLGTGVTVNSTITNIY